jgi:nucleoside-diphosphate-sugar epimerase
MNPFEVMSGKTVAVVGASGYIGSAIVDRLMELPLDILRVSRQELPPRPGVRSLKADIRVLDCWLEIVEQADFIFHLAGNTSAYDAGIDPSGSLSSTLLPITHLVSAAQQLRRKPRVVFASTATVYGLTTKLPVAEIVEPMPITVYDLHKLFAEHQLALATQQEILDGVSLRLSNVYGPCSGVSSASDRGVLNRIAARAIQGQDLIVYGDGNYLRDYVYIDDVVNAFFLAAATLGLDGVVFNIASGVGTTIKQAFKLIADEVAKTTGVTTCICTTPWPPNTEPIELRNFVAINERFVSATGWSASTSLAEGVRLLVSAYKRREKHGY